MINKHVTKISQISNSQSLTIWWVMVECAILNEDMKIHSDEDDQWANWGSELTPTLHLVSPFPEQGLREHIMGMNSSISWDNIRRTWFISTWSRVLPIIATLIWNGWSNSTVRIDLVVARILKKRPFVTFEILGTMVKIRNNDNNFTIRCLASTAGGYFEAGNY